LQDILKRSETQVTWYELFIIGL